jgi:hypothetical protein
VKAAELILALAAAVLSALSAALYAAGKTKAADYANAAAVFACAVWLLLRTL